MNIIGFGTGGCKIAKLFEKYSQYNVYYADVGRAGPNSFILPQTKTMEEAEKKTPKFKKLNKLKGSVVFICTAGGNTSGSILAFLEQIKQLDITVLYIQPDENLLNKEAAIREKVTFNILQQFARSGLLKKIFLFNNFEMSKILGNLSVMEYFNKINSTIANSFHMLNYFKNTEAIVKSVSDPLEVNRVATIGLYDMEKGEEKYFFDIENIREKNFYFAFNENVLKGEANLLNKISEKMKKAGQSEFTDISYNITATTYEENFAYIEAHTNFIQGEKILDNSPE
tara:strand:+ start:1377 stop:2228 length:852 start_codon:yes stop_codon:yes gene_type:complete